jgi:hypothetical protein
MSPCLAQNDYQACQMLTLDLQFYSDEALEGLSAIFVRINSKIKSSLSTYEFGTMLPCIDKDIKTLTFKSPIIQRKSLVSHLEKCFGFNQVDEWKFLSTNPKATTIQKRLE